MMKVFSGITVKLVNITGKDYAQIALKGITIDGLNVSNLDYYLIERIDVPINDAASIYNSYLATASQSVLYYMGGDTYMSSKIYMGGIDLNYPSTYIDIKSQVMNGISVVIDSNSDPANFLHIYRAIGLNVEGSNPDESSTPYVMLVNTSAIATGKETVVQERPRYRVNKKGRYVIKGVPSIHATPRYKGVIESSPYRGIINSVQENGKMVYGQAETLKSEIMDLFDRLLSISMDTGKLVQDAQPRDILSTEFNNTMSKYVFMNKKLFMKDPKEEGDS